MGFDGGFFGARCWFFGVADVRFFGADRDGYAFLKFLSLSNDNHKLIMRGFFY